jgi:hypothetical protein
MLKTNEQDEQMEVGVDPDIIPAHWVDKDARRQQPPLDKRWKKAVFAVGAALLADASGPPPDNRLKWMAHELENMLESIAGRGRFIFRAALFFVSVLAPLMIFRLPPIRRLSFEDTERALERFERSPMGMMLFAVQTLVCIVYFEHPDAAAEIGFDGQCHQQTEESTRFSRKSPQPSPAEGL